MEQVIKAATELGKLIGEQDSYKRLRSAEEAVQKDSETKKLLEQFETQRRKIEELEGTGKPVEVADKHEMKRLSDAVHASAPLQSLLRAQADYMEFMGRVNKAIREAIS